jgi:hypothetical protein
MGGEKAVLNLSRRRNRGVGEEGNARQRCSDAGGQAVLEEFSTIHGSAPCTESSFRKGHGFGEWGARDFSRPEELNVEELTFDAPPIDTAVYAELKEARNWGHGHAHLYGLRTRPWVSGTANALDATDLDTRRPESSKRMRAVLVYEIAFSDLAAKGSK